jgi:hypothetical protein
MLVLFLSAIALFVLRFTDYDYPFGIFKLFFENQNKKKHKAKTKLIPE